MCIRDRVGVDLPEGKNLVGAFYQPKAVLIDPRSLDTLPDRFFRDGMAEVIKYGCIQDAAFLEELEGFSSRQAAAAHMQHIDVYKRQGPMRCSLSFWNRAGGPFPAMCAFILRWGQICSGLSSWRCWLRRRRA